MRLRRLLSVSVAFAAAVTLTAVSPGAQAVFPGRNGRIAFDTDFDRHSQIFTIKPDGTGIRQLTHLSDDHSACEPRWSADGRQIVYIVHHVTRGCSETPHGRIWVMNADGTGQHQITHDPGFNDVGAAWSPDGSKIVFSRCAVPFEPPYDFNAYCDIAVVNADGTGMTTLLGGNWIHNAPSYSPDGDHISFSSNRGGYVQAVWVMNADGSELKRLTEPAIQASGPEWSPDGSRILFDNRFGVWVMAADGSYPTKLVRGGVAAGYSPDGRKIVLTSEGLGLAVVNADGTDLHPVVADRAVFSSDWQARVAP